MNRLHGVIDAAQGIPLLGAALYSYDPIFLEIAIHLGFKAIWIEMEHAPISFAEAADLCRMASGHDVLTMIRIPDTDRESVLKAAECGPDIIDIPMANSPEQIIELVQNARFAPEGRRGYFSVSRALRYGLVESVSNEQQKLNTELSLLAQIETTEALTRVDELASIPGVDLFIGPSDLAASLGVPGQTAHPLVLDAGEKIMVAARRNGKKVATACPAAEYVHWVRLGIDLLFCTNSVVCLKLGAQAAMTDAHKAIQQVKDEALIPVRVR